MPFLSKIGCMFVNSTLLENDIFHFQGNNNAYKIWGQTLQRFGDRPYGTPILQGVYVPRRQSCPLSRLLLKRRQPATLNHTWSCHPPPSTPPKPNFANAITDCKRAVNGLHTALALGELYERLERAAVACVDVKCHGSTFC